MSLLDGVKGMVTNAVVDKLSDAIGIENGMLKSAMKMFLPAVIGGVIAKGSSKSGAGGLLDLFKNGGYGDDNLKDLPSVIGDSDKRKGWMETGSDLLGTIFGSNQSGILDMLIDKTGLGKGAGGMLLKFLAPLVINKVAGIANSRNMDAGDLSSYLNDQKSDVMGAVPGLMGLLGGGASASMGARASASDTGESDDSSGGGFLKWLLPLALAALAIWFFTKDGCNKTVEETGDDMTEEVEETMDDADADDTKTVTTTAATDAAGGSVDGGVQYEGYTINDNLDIVTASGAVAHSAGTYDVDNMSNVLDRSGKVIMPAAALPGDFKTQLKSMFDRIRLARMKMMFGNMIAKKEGARTSYGLSDIEFNKENHRISNFSKAEVEGLASSLKENAIGKIEVQVHTADGKDDKENKELSETRAKVIRDMLVTLGVDKKQIEAVGMGGSNTGKANISKVDIVVK